MDVRSEERQVPGEESALLATEEATYEHHRSELVTSSADRYVLIKGHEIVGTFPDEPAAYREGLQRFGNVPFFIRRIAAVDPPVQFTSLLLGE
jgi:hypothetical protein